jgi:hypothetical protein
MSHNNPFNANPQLVAMKEDIAQRGLRIKIVGGLISAIFFGLALFNAPALGVMGSLLMLAGGGIASMITYKATKKLEIDQKFLETQMQGQNWWGGYREQVMDRGGHQPASAPIHGLPVSSQQHER